jgi:hypothetical protein
MRKKAHFVFSPTGVITSISRRITFKRKSAVPITAVSFCSPGHSAL